MNIWHVPRATTRIDSMASLSESSTAFDRAIAPVMDVLLGERARDVLQLRPDPALQARIDDLATRCTAGELTAAERSEYEEYVRANKFLAILQRQARRVLGAG
jgi:hypothetical protein